MKNYALLLFAWAALLPPVPSRADEPQRMRVDNVHVRTWNQFAAELYALHQQRIAGRGIEEKVRIGGYADLPDFYKEISYVDKSSGRLLSRIQWERAHPDRVHVIEVFFYDDHGRVTRDYTAAYLPHSRNAPVQTLISLHHYASGLHGFRTFDASGDRIFERCQGVYQGRPVDLMLDEDAIDDALHDPNGVMHSAEYRSCFGDLADSAKDYLPPH